MRWARFRPFAAKAPWNVGRLERGAGLRASQQDIPLILLRYLKMSLLTVIASEAKQSIPSPRGTMDCFAALAMTEDIASRSRDVLRPTFASNVRPSKMRWRNAGCALHPAVSCAMCTKRVRTRHDLQKNPK